AERRRRALRDEAAPERAGADPPGIARGESRARAAGRRGVVRPGRPARRRVHPGRRVDARGDEHAMRTQTEVAGSPQGGGNAPAGRDDGRAGRWLGADIIIANAPDPVFVSDLEGKILQANDAVSQLLGFRPDEVLEQSLSRFISPEETREFTAA